MPYTAKERLYLDKDGKVVKAGDPKAEKLLIAKGQTMPDKEAERYGLKSKQASGDKSKKASGNKAKG